VGAPDMTPTAAEGLNWIDFLSSAAAHSSRYRTHKACAFFILANESKASPRNYAGSAHAGKTTERRYLQYPIGAQRAKINSDSKDLVIELAGASFTRSSGKSESEEKLKNILCAGCNLAWHKFKIYMLSKVELLLPKYTVRMRFYTVKLLYGFRTAVFFYNKWQRNIIFLITLCRIYCVLETILNIIIRCFSLFSLQALLDNKRRSDGEQNTCGSFSASKKGWICKPHTFQ